MIKKLGWVLILSLVIGLPVKLQAQTEAPAKAESAPKNTVKVDIPDDIRKNLEKTPKATPKPSATPSTKQGSGSKSSNKSSSTTKNTTNANTGKKKTETPQDGKTNNNTLRPGVNKLQGYRIQVFSEGNNPTTLQARARARGNAIVAKFPKYKGQVYSFSQSPNWYTRIGNFQTSEEANRALKELKNAFPSFAGEMRVVKSSITIIKK